MSDTTKKKKVYPCHNKALADMPGEVWRDIKNFEGYYQASNMGRIRSVDRVVPHPRHVSVGQTVSGKILSQSVAQNRNLKTGEPMIDLRIYLNLEGRQHYFNTRRIIYQTFVNSAIDFQTDGLYVINADGDGYNNRVENLKVVSKSEKQKRVFKRDRQDSFLKHADRSSWPKTYGGYSTRRQVEQYKNGRLIATYESVTQASLKTGYGQKEIIMVAKERWTHYHGFVWRYKNTARPGKN